MKSSRYLADGASAKNADIAELLGVIGIISTVSEQRFTDYRNNAALSITEQRHLKRLIFMGGGYLQ